MWFSFNLHISGILNSIFHFHGEMDSLLLLLNHEALGPPLVSMDMSQCNHRGGWQVLLESWGSLLQAGTLGCNCSCSQGWPHGDADLWPGLLLCQQRPEIWT